MKELKENTKCYTKSKTYFFGAALISMISYFLFQLFIHSFSLMVLSFLPIGGVFVGFVFGLAGLVNGIESFMKKEENARFRLCILIGNSLIVGAFLIWVGGYIVDLVSEYY